MIDRETRSRLLRALDIPEWTLRPAPAAAAIAEAPAAATSPAPAGGVPGRGQASSGASAAPDPLTVADGALIGAAPAVADAGWAALRARVAACTACPLHAGRTQTVFGIGREDAELMVIGEAPGADEDRQGEPFVGRAGQLLNAMLRGLGFARADVYIANVLKCRPPQNRDPKPEESATCTPFLDRQIELIRPRAILAVGRISAQWLLATDTPIGRLRGRVHAYGQSQTPVVVTYHPAYLLRSPLAKAKSWQDLLLVKGLLTADK